MAEIYLHELLMGAESDRSVVPPEESTWVTADGATPGAGDGLSPIERRLRRLLTDRAEAAGAKVTDREGAYAGTAVITFPGAPRTWNLTPQVRRAGCMPDYLLTSNDTSIPAVAIFTDGWAFHANPGDRNRIADDAQKRANLRLGGDLVVAITAADIEAAERGTVTRPSWFDQNIINVLMSANGLSVTPAALDSIENGPIALLLNWMMNPDPAALRALGNVVPYFFSGQGVQIELPDGADLAQEAVRLLQGGTVTPSDGTGRISCWWWSDGPLGVLSRGDAQSSHVETAVVLDDREESIDTQAHRAAWSRWLEISNAVAARDQTTVIDALSAIIEQRMSGSTSATRTSSLDAAASLQGPWGELLDEVLTEERELLLALKDIPGMPLPEIGLEVGDGIPVSFAWPQRKIAVLMSPEGDDVVDVVAAGWTVVEPSAAAVSDALGLERGTR